VSTTTGIEWTEATWNPWMGCDKVSPGCAHCYMFREQTRYGQNPNVVRRSKTKFAEPLKWAEPRLVFTCSWSDWFHEGADPWRDEAWDVVRRTPHLTYQILTKRPERIAAHLPADWGTGYPNVWLGTSVENQRFAFRIEYLKFIPAAVRFVSAEPLLGPLVLGGQAWEIDWLIVGGESGPECRPMREEWARSLRDECRTAGTAFFLKQLGGWPNKRGGDDATLDGVRYTEMPEPVRG
jgi:protein gp37